MFPDITINLGNDPWAFGWEALAATGTILAVAVALGFGAYEARRARALQELEQRRNANLLMGYLEYMDGVDFQGNPTDSRPLRLLNGSPHPVMDVRVLHAIKGNQRYKQLTTLRWIVAGEDYDIGYDVPRISDDSWVSIYFKDPFGQGWLRHLNPDYTLHKVDLLAQESVPKSDTSLKPDLYFTLTQRA